MRSFAAIPLKFMLGIIGILFISCSPVLFSINNPFNFQLFFLSFVDLVKDLMNPSEWHFNYTASLNEVGTLSFNDYFKGPYLYSMTILILSLLVSLLVSFGLALWTTLTKGSVKRITLKVVKVLESFPDFSYIFLIQIVVVQVFLATDILILEFYSLGDNLVYIAPILCLSVLPTLLFFKLFILLYEEEAEQPYVELAKSKGLSQFDIFIRHCTPNVLKSIFFQSKSIVWLTLSSMLIIEYLFGSNGILYYLLYDFSPKGTTFILVSIFAPFFIFYSILEYVVNKERIERNTIFEKYNLPFLDIIQFQSILRHKRLGAKLAQTFKTLRVTLFKHRNIMISIAVVLGLMVISFMYSVLFNDQIDQINFVYNDEGRIISKAPHPPSGAVLFGTDPYGYSILQQLLVGLKYTIIITLIIATFRIVAGYIFGLIYVFYLNQKIRKIINSIADGMHFLPLTLVVFMLLQPILINNTGEWHTTLFERLLFQSLIMALIVLPVTTSLIGNEMNETLKKEYVQSSVVMGGSLLWILIKHINPQLWRKLVLFWTQHVVQVLQMFVHLGILNIFVGGARYYPDTPYRLVPKIYELSGMIAISREVFITKQFWMIIPPLLAFMLLIYCFNTIAEGISPKSALLLPQRLKRSEAMQVKSNIINQTLDSKSFVRLSDVK
ncbi:ABC transporter permease subunit [Paenisporosarcina sp. NPDC076898]|uniref:ABC transporter permease subunit n=1 Tax=unclassified Paenisporosarcina TaxID=2642018 RepID=UPI003D045F59